MYRLYSGADLSGGWGTMRCQGSDPGLHLCKASTELHPWRHFHLFASGDTPPYLTIYYEPNDLSREVLEPGVLRVLLRLGVCCALFLELSHLPRSPI